MWVENGKERERELANDICMKNELIKRVKLIAIYQGIEDSCIFTMFQPFSSLYSCIARFLFSNNFWIKLCTNEFA